MIKWGERAKGSASVGHAKKPTEKNNVCMANNYLVAKCLFLSFFLWRAYFDGFLSLVICCLRTAILWRRLAAVLCVIRPNGSEPPLTETGPLRSRSFFLLAHLCYRLARSLLLLSFFYCSPVHANCLIKLLPINWQKIVVRTAIISHRSVRTFASSHVAQSGGVRVGPKLFSANAVAGTKDALQTSHDCSLYINYIVRLGLVSCSAARSRFPPLSRSESRFNRPSCD